MQLTRRSFLGYFSALAGALGLGAKVVDDAPEFVPSVCARCASYGTRGIVRASIDDGSCTVCGQTRDRMATTHYGWIIESGKYDEALAALRETHAAVSPLYTAIVRRQ